MNVEFNLASYQAMLARACNAMQNFAEGEQSSRQSIATFERLKQERPKIVWLPRYLGFAYVCLSDALVGKGKPHWAEAMQALRSAIDNFRVFGQPRDLVFEASAHFRLAQLLASDGQRSAAKLSLVTARELGEKLVALVPSEDRCKRELLLTLTMSPISELRDSERASELARQIRPREDAMLWLLIALAEYRAGNWENAICASEQAIHRLENAKDLCQLVIALAKKRCGQDAEAIDRFDQACKSIDNAEPILFSTFMSPLTVHQLRSEAEQLLTVSP